MTREQRLEVALRHVERALREGDPAITDTLWMTRSESETCTMLDEVTMALAWPAALARRPREGDQDAMTRAERIEAAARALSEAMSGLVFHAHENGIVTVTGPAADGLSAEALAIVQSVDALRTALEYRHG